jgi:hypothetical protein
MSHLAGFSGELRGKGRIAGSDLAVHIRFSNHVVTKRALGGAVPDLRDHNGAGRVFDTARYRMSLELPAALLRMLEENGLCYISRSYGGVQNLVTLRGSDGAEWAIIFCFRPDEDGLSVSMDILSAYEKVVDQRKISRKNLSYFARQCLFEGRRIP